MPLEFPASPKDGDIFTSGSRRWVWRGGRWAARLSPIAPSRLSAEGAEIGDVLAFNGEEYAPVPMTAESRDSLASLTAYYGPDDIRATTPLDAGNHNTFIVTVTDSATFSYENFPAGKTINIYLVATHAGQRAHIFPRGTLFSDLGTLNTIYSVSEHITKISLQKVGELFLGFSTLLPTRNFDGGGSSGYVSYYGYYGNDDLPGIGLEIFFEEFEAMLAL